MRRTLTISDELYTRLQSETHNRAFESVEELFDQIDIENLKNIAELAASVLMSVRRDAFARRNDTVRKIDELHQRLLARYGQMPDSVDLLREDRAR